MNSIYVHIDPLSLPFSQDLTFSNFTFSDLPEYGKLSISQTKKFLNTEPIVIENDFIKQNFEKELTSFYELCKIGMPSFYKDPFWLLTLLRLYIVYLYAEKHQINKFIHLEYDNLIYSDFNSFKILDPSLYFTRVGPFCSSAGFIYCNSLQHFEWFIIKLQQLLHKGENVIRKFTQYEHLSEMILIDLIFTHTEHIIDYLPILPFEIGNDNFNLLEEIFDGASYGQYLGGTNNGAAAGWTGKHHYVGSALQDKKIQVRFENKPYLYYNDKKISINNLHIHSKNLTPFLV